MLRALGLALLLLPLASPNAHPATLDEGLAANYPEGPVLIGGALYVAEMYENRVLRVDVDGTVTTFWQQDGCGPTSIAPFGKGMVVLCHFPNMLVHIDNTGKALEAFDADRAGNTFLNPNDSFADDRGGVYFSAAGHFHPRYQPKGEVLYLKADKTLVRVADGLNYANGVLFDAKARRLFVSEHLANRIVMFPVNEDGTLGPQSVYFDFKDSGIGDFDRFPLSGPDGLEIDASGNLYAAHYGSGVVAVIGPDRKLAARIDWSEPLLTNIALEEGARTLILTGSQFGDAQNYPGKVQRVPNPLHDEM